MADYYSLIKKAVARLDPSASHESRLALYERAGVAQVAQLRSISPPLSETEITDEQLALEEAVKKVEAEVIQSTRGGQIPSDLLMAANEIGRRHPRAEERSSVVAAKTAANASPPVEALEMPQPMIVRGGATGRLIGYWRFRSLPPRGVA